MPSRRILPLVLLATLLPAAPAAAWSTRTVSTPRPASVSALASAGDAVATLYQQRVDGRSSLILARGSTKTVVARSPGSFDAALAYDGAHRPTVAYATVLGRGQPRKAFVWRPGRAQQLTTNTRSAFGIDVSVAPSGRAVVSWVTVGGTLRIARRATATGTFTAPQTFTDEQAFVPQTAIAPDGEAVVAYGTRTVRVTRAAAGQDFPAPVALPSRGTELTSLAMTSAGHVLIGARAVARRAGGGYDRASLLGRWDRGDAAPTTVPLSTPERVGGPVEVLARGTRAFVAWRDTGADDKGALLGLGVVDADGQLRTRQVHGAGSGSPFSGPAAIAPAGADGARVYLAPFAHAVTARTVLPGLQVGDVEHVSPADEHSSGVVAATSAGRAVAAWTTTRTDRVRLAVAG